MAERTTTKTRLLKGIVQFSLNIKTFMMIGVLCYCWLCFGGCIHAAIRIDVTASDEKFALQNIFSF